MEKFLVGALWSVIDVLSPELALHPLPNVPPQTRAVLHEYDQKFIDIPVYANDICPLAVFERPWLVSDPLLDDLHGPGANFFKKKIGECHQILKRKLERSYQLQVSKIDQYIIATLCDWGSYASQMVYTRFQSSLQTGSYFTKLKGLDYYGSLSHAYTMTSLRMDRLVGMKLRLQKLEKSFIKTEYKDLIKAEMATYFDKSKAELDFWVGRTIGTRALFDLNHQIEDAYDTLLYQEETGGPLSGSLKRQLDSLYQELASSFWNESCNQRLDISSSKGTVEYYLNAFGESVAKLANMNVKKPREFVDLVPLAQEKMKKDYRLLYGYTETPEFVSKQKIELYLNALANDNLFMGRQIALNGKFDGDREINWTKELVRLDEYKDLLEKLFYFQDGLFKVRYQIVSLLNFDESNSTDIDSIRDVLLKLEAYEFHLNKHQIFLKLSYQKTILTLLNAQKEVLEKWQSSAIKKFLRVLMKNQVFDDTPDFDRFKIKIIPMLGQVEGYLRLYLPGLFKKSPEFFVEDGIDIKPYSKESLQMTNQLYKPMTTVDEYLFFVQATDFVQASRIMNALSECEKLLKLFKPDYLWDWVREYRELMAYLSYLKRVTAIPERISVFLPSPDDLYQQNMINQNRLMNELVESFRKKVVTDFGVYERSNAKSLLDSATTNLQLAGASLIRKIDRGAIVNPVLDFRNPEFHISFNHKLTELENVYKTESLQPEVKWLK